jgi:hypothetical protein
MTQTDRFNKAGYTISTTIDTLLFHVEWKRIEASRYLTRKFRHLIPSLSQRCKTFIQKIPPAPYQERGVPIGNPCPYGHDLE